MIPSVSSAPEAAVATSSVPAAKTPVPATSPVPAVTVEISLSAQVKQLDSSGASVSEISSKTGLDTATIQLYLGQ